jgi:hypothetical protein
MYRKSPKGALLPKKKVKSNEMYRKSPKGALLSKRKVGAMKGTERVPRERYFLRLSFDGLVHI